MNIQLSQSEVEDLITSHVSKLTGLDETLLVGSIWLDNGEVRFEVAVKEIEE